MSGEFVFGTARKETDFREFTGETSATTTSTYSSSTSRSSSVDVIVEAYKEKLDSVHNKILKLNNEGSGNLAYVIKQNYDSLISNLSNLAVIFQNSPRRLDQTIWNNMEGTLYDDIKKLYDDTTDIISLFYKVRTILLKLFQEESFKGYPTLEAIPVSEVTSDISIGSSSSTKITQTTTPSGGDTYNIIGGTTGPSYTEEDIRRMFEEWMKDKENDPGTTQCECSCSPELLALLKQLTDLLNGITNNPNGVTNDEPTEGETTPSGTDVPITGAGTEDINGTTTPADDSGEGSGDNTDNELDNGGEEPETPPEDIDEDLTPDEVTPGEEEEDNKKASPTPIPYNPDDYTYNPDDNIGDDDSDDWYSINPDETPDNPDDGYTVSYVNPFDNIPDNPDNPNDPYDPDNGNKEPSGGTVNETPTPPPSKYPGGTGDGDGGSTLPPSKGPGIDNPEEPGTSLPPDKGPGASGDWTGDIDDTPTGGPSQNPDEDVNNPGGGNNNETPSGNEGQKPSGGTTDWGGDGSTGTGGTPGGTTGGDDPFAKDRDPNVSVENVGKEWVTLGGAATGAGAAAGVVGGYGGGSYGNYYATNTGNTTGDTSSTTQFAGTTDDEEKKKKAKYIFSSEQAEVENPYEGMEPDSLYGNSVVYDTLEPNGTGNTDTTSMDADGTNLGTILGIGGISAGLGVGGLYMAQAKKDAKKEEEEKKKKEQEEKDAESLGLVGGVMASSFIDDDDDDDKKKKKKQNNRSFFN